jgi:hypothetical protein
VTTGQPAATLAETVRNPNTRPLQITSAQTATPYAITADGCLAHRIPTLGSCIISVQFAPAALGVNGQIPTVDSTAGNADTQLSGAGDTVLTVTITGSGSVSDGGPINCSSGSCSEQTSKQLTLTLTATPSGGQFSGWEGACQGFGSSTTCQVTITADTSISADFEPVPS